jgi:stage II sporulation protein AA (anti-sigma F factor antagonist)
VSVHLRDASGTDVVVDAVADGQVDVPKGMCGVEIAHNDGAMTALLRGDLETSSSWDVETILADALQTRPSAFEISLEGLNFLDSSGLRVLLLLQRNAEQLGVPVTFVRPRGAVRRTLDFAKALDYLGIKD